VLIGAVAVGLLLGASALGYWLTTPLPAKGRESPVRLALEKDLRELGGAYLRFQDTEGRPPGSFEELNNKFPLPAGCSGATVFWGAGMRSMCKDNGPWEDVVVAHALIPGKDVKYRFLVTLMCDGSVRVMTADDFEAALKAKPISR
jgi:hypothetical protein